MKKRFLCTIMCLSMIAISLTGCGKKESNKNPATDSSQDSETEVMSYNIAACLSESNDYDKWLYVGFTDCLKDYLGQDSINVTNFVASDVSPTDTIAHAVTSGSYDLIFTTGKQMLVSMTTATDTIPIVATNIVDFQNVLRIAPTGSASWNKITGMNVTGVSSKPSIVDQVSLMIEATKDLQAVGILFSPEDTEAIYQNEIFETYLNQAGIPWKEYSIPASSAAIIEEEDQNTTVLTATKFVAYSSKSGMDNDVVSLGENEIIGINAPSATRTALVSSYWKGGKILPVTDTDDDSEDTSDASDSSDVSDESTQDEEEGILELSLEDRIREACNECSVIYVPFGSMLADQMDVISSICIENGVSTVSGDTTIGQNTLVTLFYDPYALGYSAGKKAVRVLNGSDITSMKISYGTSEDSVKLYNGIIAEEMGLTFPKSFSEIHEFTETYEYGSNTTRKVLATEEEEE